MHENEPRLLVDDGLAIRCYSVACTANRAQHTPNGTAHTRFSLATNVSWKDRESGEYKTRSEWHRIVVWGKFGEWAGSLKKGAFIEAEGELRYREFQPAGSDAQIRTGEIHAISILTLDRGEKTEQEGEIGAAEITGDDERRSEKGKAARLCCGPPFISTSRLRSRSGGSPGIRIATVQFLRFSGRPDGTSPYPTC